jgi:siroheme decarboxylase
MASDMEKKVISLIQGDLPFDKNPFAILAEKAGIGEDEFISILKDLKRRGIMRRFGATLRHQEAGFSSNAMIAWKVPEDKIDQTGEEIASFREVTHCYRRETKKGWPFNLYTMVHGNNREQCHAIAEKISRKVGIGDYTLLFSEREFKKTSMEYF